jgi:Na+(H+)/acetate symporter ActP
MKGTLLGLGVTSLIWAALVGAYAAIELVRGHRPFEMLQWEVGGKFVTIVILLVLFLGGMIGYTSDRIRRTRGY